jgi:hypothetical protein
VIIGEPSNDRLGDMTSPAKVTARRSQSCSSAAASEMAAASSAGAPSITRVSGVIPMVSRPAGEAARTASTGRATDAPIAGCSGG